MLSLTGKRVLIVDDDLGDTFLLQKILFQFGVHTVESVDTGDEAAKYLGALAPYFHRRLPDVIFLDLKMAGMTGFELIAWLKQSVLFSHIPIIVFSNSHSPIDKARAIELGAAAFYEKTPQADKLKEIVRAVFNITKWPAQKVEEAQLACVSD